MNRRELLKGGAALALLPHFFKAGANPLVVIRSPWMRIPPNERRKLIDAFREKYNGLAQGGEPIVLDLKGIKFVPKRPSP